MLSPEKQKAYRLSKYGLTPEQYTALLHSQGGLCAICGGPPSFKGLCIDHYHKTGVVRGILCFHCNTAIGKMKDSPAQLRAAALYLEERANGVVPGTDKGN